jgi:hypothetical protein
MATGAESPEKRALRQRFDPGTAIIEPPQERERLYGVFSSFDSQYALANCRHEFVDSERDGVRGLKA